ncbi:MAG: hypothetical protein DRP73_03950, partial [Candidatus Omnitrophota bacterium]
MRNRLKKEGWIMQGKKVAMVVLLLLMAIMVISFRAYGEWPVSFNATLNGSNYATLEWGMKEGATDNFDNGIDALAPPASPDGDNVYFSSITGEPSPYNKLLKDYRGISEETTTWRLVVKVASGKTMVISWDGGTLPSGWVCTWQEADSNWNGVGDEHNLSDTPNQIEVSNTTGDLLTKRYLIKAQVLPTYSISGTVTLQGGGADVTEVLLTLSGDASATTNPDAQGNYSFTGLSEGEYWVTPSLNKYRFEPPFRSYNPLNSDQTNQDYTGIYQCDLTVNSAHDDPDPSVGTHTYDWNTQITASVTSPADQTDGTRYICTGWT